MPYQVGQIIEGRGMPVCVTEDDAVAKALSLMIEHDFSQLPVIKKENNFDVPKGMITYDGILRGIRNFKARIEDLKVRDVMNAPTVYSFEDDLFDILDRLKDTNAVLVIDEHAPAPDLVGIVTSYDTAEYFRNRTEDLMRVEDIELMIKDFIKAAYTESNDELNHTKLDAAIVRVTNYPETSNTPPKKKKAFGELNLGEYINLLLLKETWSFFEPIFAVQRDFVQELLNGVREIRNALAHFRGDISAEQRDRLKFGAEWLMRRQEEYQSRIEREKYEGILASFREQAAPLPELAAVQGEPIQYGTNIPAPVSSTDFSVTESATSGGRYAALADWLQSQPGRFDQVQLTLNQIEKIIQTELPASARKHRAWWANDSVGHSHSQLWLDAGWRTTYINLTEGRVNFSRIQEREKAYIAFFSRLLDELRRNSDFPVREASPDGASWIVVQTIPRRRATFGSFAFAFSRDKRLRVELYLDLGDQDQTKAAYDKLLAEQDPLEARVGKIEWERLDNRRASRLAVYHEGHISEEQKLAELCKWAVETMPKFYNALLEPAEKAILEVKKQ